MILLTYIMTNIKSLHTENPVNSQFYLIFVNNWLWESKKDLIANFLYFDENRAKNHCIIRSRIEVFKEWEKGAKFEQKKSGPRQQTWARCKRTREQSQINALETHHLGLAQVGLQNLDMQHNPMVPRTADLSRAQTSNFLV